MWLSAGKGAAAAAQKGDAQVQAETHKTAGNEAFKAGAYEEAVRAYSQAIESNPACAVYWSNRAQAYLKVSFLHSRDIWCVFAIRLILRRTLCPGPLWSRGRVLLECFVCLCGTFLPMCDLLQRTPVSHQNDGGEVKLKLSDVCCSCS